jgi:hypothetical protein
LKPSSLALSTWIQRPTGGLSTETNPPTSDDTKKKLRQLASMLSTAAA